MKIITYRTEDFNNYKKPCMLIGMPYCNFKCNKECGKEVCQNQILIEDNIIEIHHQELINKYMNNNLIKAICFGGLEPFDSWNDLKTFISAFRNVLNDDIVIYTGYYKNELETQITWLKQYPNIIIKFGRFIPNQAKHFDEILGVWLASDNQYAEKIS